MSFSTIHPSPQLRMIPILHSLPNNVQLNPNFPNSRCDTLSNYTIANIIPLVSPLHEYFGNRQHHPSPGTRP